MSLAFNNSAANILNTPGFISDVYASIPNASYLAIGTIFFATDTGAIYQTDGTNWYSLGGGGGSQNLQQVLTVGNSATNEHIELYDTSGASYSGFYYANLIQLTDLLGNYLFINNIGANPYLETNVTGFGASKLNFGQLLFTNDNIAGIACVDTGSVNISNIGLSPTVIKTYYNGVDMGINLDSSNLNYQFGDYAGQNKHNYFYVDDSNEEIRTVMAGVLTGIFVDRVLNVYIGDYTGNLNLNYTEYDNNNGNISNFCNTEFHYIQNLRYDDNGSGSLISGSAGGSSGNHLVISINGTPYKIALLNP